MDIIMCTRLQRVVKDKYNGQGIVVEVELIFWKTILTTVMPIVLIRTFTSVLLVRIVLIRRISIRFPPISSHVTLGSVSLVTA